MDQHSDAFSDSCRSEDVHSQTGSLLSPLTLVSRLSSVLTAIIGWARDSVWTPSEQEPSSTLNKQVTSPPCQGSAADVLLHLISTVWDDGKLLCATVVDVLHNSCSTLAAAAGCCIHTTQVISCSFLGQCWGALSVISESVKAASLHSVLPALSEVCKQVVSVLPQSDKGSQTSAGIAVVLLCFVACAVAGVMCCRTGRHERSWKWTWETKPSEALACRHAFHIDRSDDVLQGAGRLSQDNCGHLCQAGGVRKRGMSLTGMLMYLMAMLLCVSFPWEFCRLYQQAVANRAAVASTGAPVECSGVDSLSLLQSLRVSLSRQLAWSHDNACEHYFNTMFVNPLWEVTPTLVVMSLLTRCVIQPTELLSSGLGRSLRAFLLHVPLHWQPVCFLLLVTFSLLALLVACSYRLSVPLLFRIEPRTPVLLARPAAEAGTGRGRGRKAGDADSPQALHFVCRQTLPLCCGEGTVADSDSTAEELLRPGEKGVNVHQRDHRQLTGHPATPYSCGCAVGPTDSRPGQRDLPNHTQTAETLTTASAKSKRPVKKTATSNTTTSLRGRVPLHDVTLTSNRSHVTRHVKLSKHDTTETVMSEVGPSTRDGVKVSRRQTGKGRSKSVDRERKK